VLGAGEPVSGTSGLSLVVRVSPARSRKSCRGLVLTVGSREGGVGAQAMTRVPGERNQGGPVGLVAGSGPPADHAVEPVEALVAFFKDFYQFRNLLFSFVANDLRFRYVGSSIGFFWTVIDPIVELAIYTFVFSVLLKVRFAPEGDTTNYALFLFCGMITWFNIQETLSRCTSVLSESAHLIKKMKFPSVILPSQVVLSGMVNQAIRILILLLGVLITGYGVSYHVLFVPLLMFAQILFTLGLGMIVATLSMFFKDISHVMKAGLMVWMFVTPIFYPPAAFPRKFYALLVMNPLAHLVGMYQELLLNLRIPHQGSIIIFGASALFLFFVGSFVFARYQDQFADLV